jgi:hemoglobin
MPMTGTKFRATFAAMAVASSMLLGCAAPPPPSPPSPSQSLYDRLGGQPAIIAVVDDAIGNASADPRINQRFNAAGIPRLKKNLADLICLRTGGPCKYTGQSMADAHEGMHITDAEFDALAEDIGKSLNKFKVPAREQGELMAALGQMRNAVVDH